MRKQPSLLSVLKQHCALQRLFHINKTDQETEASTEDHRHAIQIAWTSTIFNARKSSATNVAKKATLPETVFSISKDNFSNKEHHHNARCQHRHDPHRSHYRHDASTTLRFRHRQMTTTKILPTKQIYRKTEAGALIKIFNQDPDDHQQREARHDIYIRSD